MKNQPTNQILERFQNMTEKEKDALVHGVEFVIDCSYIPDQEDFQLYELIIEERRPLQNRNTM